MMMQIDAPALRGGLIHELPEQFGAGQSRSRARHTESLQNIPAAEFPAPSFCCVIPAPLHHADCINCGSAMVAEARQERSTISDTGVSATLISTTFAPADCANCTSPAAG